MPEKPGAAKEDEIGPWSEQKLQLLGSYLHAYSVIMNAQKKEWLRAYHYIDAFAGSVYPKPKESKGRRWQQDPQLKLEEAKATELSDDDQETSRFIAGSPVRALETEPSFDVYWFMEISEWRLAQLAQLSTRFPNRDIRIEKGDCNQTLLKTVVPKITWESYQRGMVFLDPYGLQVEWATVRSLAEAHTFDIFVNFPLMAITRLLKRDAPPDPTVMDLLTRVMGNRQWIDELYQQAQQLDMFEEPVTTRGKLTARQLASVYAKQMGQLFPYVSKPVIMTNSKNAALYALFLASHKDAAVNIMNDVSKNRGLRQMRG